MVPATLQPQILIPLDVMSSLSSHYTCPATRHSDTYRKGCTLLNWSWLVAVVFVLALPWTVSVLAADLGSAAAIGGSSIPAQTAATKGEEKLWAGTVTLSEEFNDNVNENSSPRSDMITILQPTLKLNYLGNRTSASLTYEGSMREYAFSQRRNEFLNNLDAKAALEAIKNLVFVEASDSNKMVFTDATLGESSSTDSTSTQVNQNILIGGVAIKPVSWERTPVSLGVRHTQTTYWDGSGIDKSSQEAFLGIMHWVSPQLEMGGDIRGLHQQSFQSELNRISASMVFRYTYAEGSLFYGRGGLIGSQIEGETNNLKPLVSFGLTHPIGRTTLSLDGQSGYIDNPSSTQDTFRSTATASLFRQFVRSTLAVYAGFTDYSGQGTPETRQLSVGLKGAYELTPRLSVIGSESYITNSTTGQTLDRLYGSYEIRYELPSNYTLSMWYRSKISDSSTTSTKNYHVNMVGLGLKKTF